MPDSPAVRRRVVLRMPAAAVMASPGRAAWSALTELSGLALLVPPHASAQSSATPSALTRALRARGLRSDALKVDFPPLADSGLAVPYTVDVVAPPGRLLQSLELLLPENPMPLVMRLRLPVPQARYRLSTRLRLAASQEAWVVATFNDGSQQGVGAPTVVTASACLDES